MAYVIWVLVLMRDLMIFIKKLCTIAPVELEDIDVTIKLANRDTIKPIGIVRDVEVLCGKVKYPADLLVLGSPQDDFFSPYF